MKQMMKYTFAIVTMLLVSLGAKALGDITVNGTLIINVDGASPNTYTSTEGTVSGTFDWTNRLVTLTITPAEGYFVMKDNITVVKTVNGNYAQTRTPGFNTPLELTGDDVVIGPTAKTYTFTMPEDENYGAAITLDFQAVIDITDATITLAETSYTYDGTEKKPSVSSVKLSGAELNATYYNIGYSNNTNAGTATVTVTGSGIYKNAASTTFTIAKAAAGLAYSQQSVEVTNRAQWTQPTLTNPHSLAITYASSKTEVATIDTDGKVSIVGAGTTTISAAFAGSDNYEAQTVSYELTVKNLESGIEWTDARMDYVIGTFWWGPRLTNPNNLEVKYSSDDEDVATIDEKTGEITVVGPGRCYIIATFEGNDQYEAKSVKYLLHVTEEYKLWVGSTQVTSENADDILGDGHFFFDLEDKIMVITNNSTPQVIESRMNDLIIFLNGGSKMERVWYNNEGNAESTGRLKFTTFNNIPGSVDFSTSDANGVISGFSSLTIDEDAFLYLLDPEEGSYQGGRLVNKGGAVAQVATIGQYLKPLVNGSIVVFPPEKLDGKDLTNAVIDDVLMNLLQHTEDTDADDDYYDNTIGAIVMNNTNTVSGIRSLTDPVNKGELLPGSDTYAQQFDGIITFMLPDGEGKIILNVQTEDGYALMLQIGENTAQEIVQNERGDVTIDYSVTKPTFCWLYLVKKTNGNTRIGKREKSHGKVFSLKVSPVKSTANPLGSVPGFPDSKTPEVETGSTGDPTGIREIKIDGTTPEATTADDNWYDLQGRRIEKPIKAGFYINSKKKVMIK